MIQPRLHISERETVAQIKENPYLQYFLALNYYDDQAPFDSSMLVYFRFHKRIKPEIIDKINRQIVKQTSETEEEKKTQINKQKKKKNKPEKMK